MSRTSSSSLRTHLLAPLLLSCSFLSGACSEGVRNFPGSENPIDAETETETGNGDGTGTPLPTSPEPEVRVVCTPGCTDEPRATESCADAKTWNFCGQDWFENHCQKTCGVCSGTEAEVCVEVPVTPVVSPPPPGSAKGWASRYWDCCKQHCSWQDNVGAGNPTAASCSAQNQLLSSADEQSSCQGGGAHTCWSMAPWSVSTTLAYGFAAVPPGGACGKCYQLEFNGRGEHNANDPGSKSLAGKKMIVQATNIGHDVNGGQFDILIPGGGVGAFNACSSQWGVSDLGAQYGGLLTACEEDVTCLRKRCNEVFTGKGDLLEGCLFHADWMAGANNPQFYYTEVACPAELKQVSGM